MTLPNLNHLKYFVDAIDLQSMSEAARKNHVTHPAVSRAIQALESQMNLRLFVHQKKSFQPTEAGLQLANQARALLQASLAFQSGDLANTEPLTGKIRLGLSRTLARTYLKKILHHLKQALPNVRVEIELGPTSTTQEGVASGSIDFGLTIGAQSFPTLKQSVVHTGKFILVESRHRKKRTSQHLNGFILTEPRYETELLKKEFSKHFKSSVEVIYEIRSWDMIAELAAENLGIGLIPEIALESQKNLQLRVLPAEWFHCDYEVVLHENRLLARNDLQRKVAEILRACF